MFTFWHSWVDAYSIRENFNESYCFVFAVLHCVKEEIGQHIDIHALMWHQIPQTLGS